MKDLVAALIGVVVIVMVARDLVMGFRNGRMAILATGAPKADRVANEPLSCLHGLQRLPAHSDGLRVVQSDA
uniref:Uncharacterized protein n=1 Tax=Phenylobacterium glaciei TaxID=2803784 RepID=A0A974P2L7_9CAUL|nr:hypothetical protein JKL49_23680 [Phenylobacterium glaciei]